MAQYEMVREIFNRCSGNQMRDVSIEEVEVDDPAVYVRSIIRGEQVHITQETGSDGALVFDVDHAGLRQRFSFTEI